MSRYGWFASTVLSLTTLLGCSGAAEPENDAQEEATAAGPERASHVDVLSHSNRDDDSTDEVEWLCKASPTGGGPIFYEVDWDLSRAMEFARAECERQMREPCAIRGCRLLRHRW